MRLKVNLIKRKDIIIEIDHKVSDGEGCGWYIFEMEPHPTMGEDKVHRDYFKERHCFSLEDCAEQYKRVLRCEDWDEIEYEIL